MAIGLKSPPHMKRPWAAGWRCAGRKVARASSLRPIEDFGPAGSNRGAKYTFRRFRACWRDEGPRVRVRSRRGSVGEILQIRRGYPLDGPDSRALVPPFSVKVPALPSPANPICPDPAAQDEGHEYWSIWSFRQQPFQRCGILEKLVGIIATNEFEQGVSVAGQLIREVDT